MSIQGKAERLFPERTVRRCLAVLSLVFAASVPAGYFAPQEGFKELAEAFTALTVPHSQIAGGTLFLLVLMNNVFASMLLMFSGLLAGILPSLSVVFNGFVLGLIYRHVSGTMGHEKAAISLLPPAIFEIPALLVAASFGVWLGIGVIRRIRKKENAPVNVQVNHAFERYFALVFPLLVAAAAVETFLVLRGH
jgi:stage II sporulation protein M